MTDAFMAAAPPVKPPWDQTQFQVARSGTRGYTDTLPADDVWPAWSEVVPGFSSLKPSKPFRKSTTVDGRKYTVPLDWYRAGEWVRNPTTVMPIVDDDYWHAFYSAVHVQRDRDFARGHAIHAVAEATLLGQPVPQWATDNTDAAPYLPHIRQWITDNVADVHAIEAVVFNRSLGYGGTGDAWLTLNNGLSVYADWKSRGADSAHGIYEEEIAQGGAYTGAEYMIGPTEDRTAARRIAIPSASHGLVVSIRPDGVEAFYYDLDIAREAFGHMLAAYRSTSDAGKAARRAKVKLDKIAAPMPPIVEQPAGVSATHGDTPATLIDNVMKVQQALGEASNVVLAVTNPSARRTWLRNRGKALVAAHGQDAIDRLELAWPVGVAKFTDCDTHTDDELDRVAAMLDAAETYYSMPFGERDPATRDVTPTPAPVAPVVTHLAREVDEGAPADAATLARLKATYDALDAAGKSWLEAITVESMQAGRSIHLSTPTLRRARILEGLLILAAGEADDADVTRALCHIALADDAALFPSIPLGDVVSAMSATEAATFVAACELFVGGRLVDAERADGRFALKEVA